MTLRAWMIIGVVLAASTAGAQGGAAPGAPLRFDFEQDRDGDGFPDEWRSVDGRHPQNIRERLDAAERRGRTSLLVEPDGLTNVYETTAAYPFDPRLSYRLSGWVKTRDLPASGLRAAVARVEAALLGLDGKTVVFTAATRGVTGTTDWTEVWADIPRDVTRPARRVRLRLVTDGPALSGKVWFDDVALEPRPTLRVSAGRGGGILSSDDPHVARFTLDTLLPAHRDCKLLVKLLAPDGVPLTVRVIDVTPDLGFTAEARAELPFRAFGLHRIEVDLLAAGLPVAKASQPVLYWPAPGAPRRDFGVAAGSLAQLAGDRMTFLERSPFGTVTADLFGEGGPDAIGTPEALARLRQVSGGIEPVVVLGRVSEGIVRRLFRERRIADGSEATWPRILALGVEYASRELAEAVKPVAARTLYFQLGDRPAGALTPGEIRRAVARLRDVLKPITWDFRIALVVDGTESDEWLAAAGADVLVLAASAWESGAVEARAARLRAKAAQLWVEAPVPTEADDARKRADRLIERMVRAKAAGADRVIVTPMEGGLVDASGAPTEALCAAATVARELGGRTLAAKLATKTPAWVFTGEAGARLAVAPAQTGAHDTIPLGPNPLRIGPDGGVSPILTGRIAPLDDLGRPYFLDGIDLDALLRKSAPRR